jgi:hypothetical protein
MYSLLYRDVSHLQIIDFHEVTDDKGNKCAERGAYDKETGQMVLGIRVISIVIKNDENDPENVSYKEEVHVGEFKDGKLHGKGRIYTDSWYFDEGEFEEGKLKEGELSFNYECDDYRCTLYLHSNSETEE